MGKILDRIEKVLDKEKVCKNKKSKDRCELKIKYRLSEILDKLFATLEKMTKGKKPVLTNEEKDELMSLINLIK